MFNVSVKGKYGLAAVVELELNRQHGPLLIKKIAESQCIPQNYLEQILLLLKRAGIVQSFRGSQGGYMLAKPADAITVLDVLKILEGPIQLCDGAEDSKNVGAFWNNLQQVISEHLSLTIGDLVRQKIAAENIATYSI